MFGFYGIPTFVDYLMPNPFLYKGTVLFQTTLFSIGIIFAYTQLNVKSVLFQTIQFSISTASMSKTVPFQTIQFSIQNLFHFKDFSLA